MPEKPEKKKESSNELNETPAEKDKSKKKGTWSEDQRENSYYYDDTYGYEVYNPDNDDESDN